MRLVLNLLILLLVAVFGYMLYTSIKEPIAFKAEKDRRIDVVKNRLINIRESQEIFRDITGQFAHDFDTLVSVLKSDSIKFENIVEDLTDPTNPDKFKRFYTYTNALDSINALGINLEELRYVPFTDNQSQFKVEADTLTYQKTLVHVVQVATRYSEFMGQYASPRFSKYDNSYDPNNLLKFGDMSKPSLSGNWER